MIDLEALRKRSSDFRCAIFAMLASVMKADGVFARYKYTLCENRVWLRKPVAHKNEARKQRDDPKWAVPKRPMAHKNERT